jgi:FixJ family two-component response regulator
MHRDTIFIVDDDPNVRDALSLMLSLKGHATATFDSAESFLAAMRPDWRGCLILDVRMPGMSGLELQKRLADAGGTLPVIVMTAHGDVAAARQAFLAKAIDFIEKPFDGDQLVAAVDKALMRPAAVPVAAGSGRQRPPLTVREREVMLLLAQGLHNRGIAQSLGISPRTVEVHKARVMDKLGVSTLVELARQVDQGLV